MQPSGYPEGPGALAHGPEVVAWALALSLDDLMAFENQDGVAVVMGMPWFRVAHGELDQHVGVTGLAVLTQVLHHDPVAEHQDVHVAFPT